MTSNHTSNTPNAATLDADIAAFEAMADELEAHHNGKWVLFFDTEFVGAFDTFDTAAQEAVRRFGRGPYLIRQIGASIKPLSASILYRPLTKNAAS